MALIKCTECGFEMSEYADKCPKCGCPTNIILEKLRKKQWNDSQINNNGHKQTLTDSVMLTQKSKDMKSIKTQIKHKTARKYILSIVILALVSLLIWKAFGKPTIADVSIDKVTPELKKAVQQYDKLDDFHEGLAAVCKNGKWGFIDKAGHEIIPCKYKEVKDFCNGVAVVEQDDKSGIIDKYGSTIVPIRYNWINRFSKGDSLTSAGLNGKQGILNIKGETVIPFEYDEVNGFKEGLMVVKKDEKYGCIDKNNNVIIPLEYEDAGFRKCFSQGLIALKKDGKFGYLNRNGSVVIPFNAQLTGDPFISGLSTLSRGGALSDFDYVDGRFISKNTPYQMALINQEGKQVTDFFTGEYHLWVDGYVTVKNGETGLQGLMDTRGRIVIPIKFWLVGSEIKEGLVFVGYNTKQYGFVDINTGGITIPCVYEPADDFTFEEGLWAVRKNGKCGFINRSNQEVIPFVYDKAKSFSEGFAVVVRYGKYGYVDRFGVDTFS
jgi:bifunctional DNA-binding transcriptional regulator/antitoxin component of YhaV-PrlF toxin-antitoxin module